MARAGSSNVQDQQQGGSAEDLAGLRAAQAAARYAAAKAASAAAAAAEAARGGQAVVTATRDGRRGCPVSAPAPVPAGCPVGPELLAEPAVQPATPVDPAAAADFLTRFHVENGLGQGALARRLAAALDDLGRTGTYEHTAEELAYGAKLAWRNSARCIGRLYWRSLLVRDRRAVRTPAEVAAECVEHLRAACPTGGRIRPALTVFAPDAPDRPGPRIWNDQLVRYAGHRQADGTVLGDPRTAGLTELAGRLGWTGTGRPASAFDVLPLMVDDGVAKPEVFELPAGAVHEVPLSHPDHGWFAELGLRWYAVPAIANMCLEIGGVCYQAAPFNGWYMGTEIGARNLADDDRYALLPLVAERLGLDTSTDRTMWKDRALVELNVAVLHSFDAAGVTMADHHTESRRFLTHLAKEEAAGRATPADWSWIVPPVSGGITPVFHRYYDEQELTPNFALHEAARSRAAGVF